MEPDETDCVSTPKRRKQTRSRNWWPTQRFVQQNAEAAHKIAEAEHKQLVASLTSAERDKREHYKRRAARLAKSPAHARRKSQPKTRKDEKIFPDGQDSVNVAGLGAEEHLAAIHADQFHRLLRADSFDDFQDM